jgi:hypothetical protein
MIGCALRCSLRCVDFVSGSLRLGLVGSLLTYLPRCLNLVAYLLAFHYCVIAIFLASFCSRLLPFHPSTPRSPPP